MAETKRKGDIGQSVIMAKLMLAGYKVAIPVGEDWRFDLIVLRENRLLRVQCKYVTSDGHTVTIPCRSCNNWSIKKYTPDEVDWIIAYDSSTGKCYYIPSSMLGESGRSAIQLRLKPTKNGQEKGINLASKFESW